MRKRRLFRRIPGPVLAFILCLGPGPQASAQTSASGPVGVPLPGQTAASGQIFIQGQTVAPGQIVIQGQESAPGQAVTPGQQPVSAPAGVPLPGQTPAQGQTASPGQTVQAGQPVQPAPWSQAPAVAPVQDNGPAQGAAAVPGGAPGAGGIPIITGIPGENAAVAAVAVDAGALSLEDTLRQLGSSGRTAELRWDPFFGAGTFVVADHNAVFDTGNPGETGFILLDFREILPVPAPYVRGGLLWFPEAFVASLKQALDTQAADEGSRFRIAAIIVDPGHGGRDAGAVGNHVINGKNLRLVEKDITLATSLLLHTRLSAAYPDKRVLLTRDGDTYPTLEDRVNIANSVHLRDNEAIVFISIHANASFNKSARGFEVWYLSPEYRRTVIDREKYEDSAEVIPILNAMLEEEFTTESIMMAQALVNRVEESLGSRIPSRGIKAEEWFVVRNARMPSVLVEMGFVSNESDALLMTDDAYLRDMADSLYKGIVDFVTAFEGTGGFTAIR